MQEVQTWRERFEEMGAPRGLISGDTHANHERAFVRRRCRGKTIQHYEVCRDCRCLIRGPIRKSQAPTDLEPMTLGEIFKWLGTKEKFSKRGRFKSQWKRLYQRYLGSPEWRKLRRAVFTERGGSCEICGDAADQVHHLNYDRIGAELMTDLMAICDSCHRGEHKRC